MSDTLLSKFYAVFVAVYHEVEKKLRGNSDEGMSYKKKPRSWPGAVVVEWAWSGQRQHGCGGRCPHGDVGMQSRQCFREEQHMGKAEAGGEGAVLNWRARAGLIVLLMEATYLPIVQWAIDK